MGDKLVRAADTQILVSKVREVGRRSKLDREKLISAGLAVAKRDSSDILSGLNGIASDGVVSPTEKRQLDLLYRQLEAEHPTVDSEAGKYSELSSWTASDAAKLKAYDDAYEAFSRLLSDILKDMDSSSQISQAVLSEVSQSYYTALKELEDVLQGFRYGIFGIEYRYKATSTQDRPSADDVTLTEPPAMSPTEKYLWRKQTITYTNGRTEVTVELIAIYGDSGESAKVCTIDCDREYVERNDRLSDSLVYTFTIEVQGYSGAVTVEVNEVDRTSSLSTEGSRYTLKVAVARKEAYALAAVVKLDGEEMARLALTVVDMTVGALYLGHFSDNLPVSSKYGMLIEGDYFIASGSFADSNGTQYAKGVPYTYRKDGSSWAWSELDSTDRDYSTKMLQCMGGVFESGIAVPSTAAMYGWFQSLVAQNAVFATLASNESFIERLFANKLIINELATFKGTIVNSNGDNIIFETKKNASSSISFSGSKKQGTDTPDAYSYENVYSYFNSVWPALSDKTVYTASGTIEGKAVAYIARFSNVNGVDNRGRISGFDYVTGSSKTAYTNNGSIPVKVRISGYRAEAGIDLDNTYMSAYSITCNGKVVVSRQLEIYRIYYNGSHSSFASITCTCSVNPGQSIVVYIGPIPGTSLGAYFDVSIYESDNWVTGINFLSSDFSKITLPSSGYGTKKQSLTFSNTTKTIELTSSSIWPDGVKKLYYFVFSNAPSNNDIQVASSFLNTSKTFVFGGIDYSQQVLYVQYSSNFMEVKLSTGITLSFGVGHLCEQYEFAFSPLDKPLGIYAKNILPVDENSSIGGVDDDYKWETVYAKSFIGKLLGEIEATGNLSGNVNSGSSPTDGTVKVWRAVFN